MEKIIITPVIFIYNSRISLQRGLCPLSFSLKRQNKIKCLLSWSSSSSYFFPKSDHQCKHENYFNLMLTNLSKLPVHLQQAEMDQTAKELNLCIHLFNKNIYHCFLWNMHAARHYRNKDLEYTLKIYMSYCSRSNRLD